MRTHIRQKSAFTLIEMLVASTIFAIVVVIAAGVFGSSAKMQITTQSSIHNQELASLINERIFDDLKSSTGWATVQGLRDAETVYRDYRIKGIAFLKLTSADKLIIPTAVRESEAAVNGPNVIVGFSGPAAATTATIFYYNSGKIYKKVIGPTELVLPVTASDLRSYLNDVNGAEIKTDSSTIQEFKLSGQNYISNTSAGLGLSPLNNVQPLVNLDLIIADKRQNNIILETRTSFSSRNYIEESN